MNDNALPVKDKECEQDTDAPSIENIPRLVA